MTPPSYATPIAQRGHKGHAWLFRALLFGLFFDGSCIAINATQFLLLPLRFVPFLPGAQIAYERGIQYTKGCFGTLLVLVSQWFAPTKFVVTVEGGSEDQLGIIFERDAEGNVTSLRLPDKLVVMANHQVYTDWLYLWCFAYFANAHDALLIVLKKSLKHIPVIGWGMQFFRFIFLARSWVKDRVPLGKHIVEAAERAKAAKGKLSLIIFPEGTLISKDTRPLSRKYAEKCGIPDLQYTILPRSTGLFCILRSMAPTLPDLKLLDITIGYSGIPPAGYGQDFYTLRSIFFQGIAPPAIHLNLRLYSISEIPLGSVNARDNDVGRGVEATVEEAAMFEKWLINRWVEKDQLMDGFYKNGHFSNTGDVLGTKQIEIPISLRSTWEIGNALCFLAPVVVYYSVKSALQKVA